MKKAKIRLRRKRFNGLLSQITGLQFIDCDGFDEFTVKRRRGRKRR